MKALGFCRDRELLKHLIGTDRIYVYLFGNVAVLAKSDHDVNRFLYATSLPKKIPLEEIENLYCNAASIAVSRLYGEDIVVVSDIGSNDYAVVIAHRLAQQLESLSPFAVKRIDVIQSYRSSEDGGYTIKNQVVIAIDSRFISPNVIEELVRRVLDEVRSLCRDNRGENK